MKQRMIRLIVAASLMLIQPAMLLAADGKTEARLAGYDKPVILEGGSSIVLWLIVVGLAIGTVGVLFKDAKRTHLD